MNPERVLATLAAHGSRWRGPVVHLATTASTQDVVRQAAAAGAPEGHVAVADEQTHGRGRQGRAWVAPVGSALLASVLLRPAVAASQLPPLALVVGLALHDALAPLVPPGRLRLKWPNDLLLDGRKLAGVLVEASLRGDRPEAVVAGFGINLTPAALPPDVAARAACLAEATGSTPERDDILARALVALDRRLATFVRSGLAPLLPDLRSADATHGRRVRWGDHEATAQGIDDEGRLLLDTPTGPVAAVAGEVVFL